jgi:hypothetical protein
VETKNENDRDQRFFLVQTFAKMQKNKNKKYITQKQFPKKSQILKKK